MSLKEALAHHRYLFRQMEAVRPSFCVFALFVAITTGIAGFVSNIVLLRYGFNAVQRQAPFTHIAVAFGVWLLVDLFIKSVRYAYQVWRIPLMAHDMHHHFAHLHVKNITIKHLIEEVTATYESLIRGMITCVANGILLCFMDPHLLLFALLPLVTLPLHTRQRALRGRVGRETTCLQTRLHGLGYSLRSYRESCGDVLRLLKRDGRHLAAVGYAVALLSEVVLEIGGMLYAVYGTVQGWFGYGDCLIAVTAIGSLSHTLLHLPELFASIRRHGEDAAHVRALTEGGDAA